MGANELRREADIARLNEMAARSCGRIQVLEAPARAGRPIRVRIDMRTVPDRDYPRSTQPSVQIRFDLPSRYPFERPVITIETPIFHPNVFPNGVVCQGEKWLPSHGMDLILQRMIDLLSYAPSHVNPASAANRSAAMWYQERQRGGQASLFPTDRVPLDAEAAPRVGASGAASSGAASSGATSSGAERVLRHCPHCAQAMRLPSGRSGTVACPRCRSDFEVST